MVISKKKNLLTVRPLNAFPNMSNIADVENWDVKIEHLCWTHEIKIPHSSSNNSWWRNVDADDGRVTVANMRRARGGNAPASLASSSLGMPLILLCLTEEHFLFSCVWALNFTQLRILSTIPQLVAWRWQRETRHSTRRVLSAGKTRTAKRKCTYGLDKLVGQKTFGTKAFGLQGHVFFGLGVEAWILNECIHKDPNVVFHLRHSWKKKMAPRS